VIRRAALADAADLARLHAAAFLEPWDERALAAMLGGVGALALMSEKGFILLRAIAGEAEILTLAVQEDARRQGLGLALIEAAAKVLCEDVAALFLEVSSDNIAALALYAKTGFEPVGRRAGYYRRAVGADMDALILRRTLTPSLA